MGVDKTQPKKLDLFCRVQKLQHIAIIGQGNVSGFLSKALDSKGFDVSVFARNPRGGAKPLMDFSEHKEVFQLVLLCINDDAVAQLSGQIPAAKYMVAHVSGNVGLDTISEKHSSRGVFYPLMSLQSGSTIPVAEIPFCIEAVSEENLQLLQALVRALGAHAFIISSKQRRYLHLAAVFAHNFGNFMFTQAQQIMDAQELDFKILVPLLQQQLETVGREKARNVQTGPAMRKDEETIKEHLSLLDPQQQELYTLITKQIQQEYES
jgi:predicted short-subunit dehydrogenase-like oxidoreductase (DUF2520 family)